MPIAGPWEPPGPTRREYFTSDDQAGSVPALGGYAEPWEKPDPDVPGRQNIVRLSEDYCVPNRFQDKTVIVTGCARGMGALAATRLAREGANVVGVDWISSEGQAVIDAITAAGGKAVFLPGDISEDAVCAEMVQLAVDTYGGLDAALNNAGVMDAINPADPINTSSRSIWRCRRSTWPATTTGTWCCG